MKALILAAGDGSRLGDLTKDKPKALIQLLGLSLIERVILIARQAGIREFEIVVGYQGDKIKALLGSGEKFGIKISYIENSEWHEENGISVLKAKESLNKNFVILMADHIFDERILKVLINYVPKCSVVLAIDRRESLPDDTKVLEKNGKIENIGKNIEGNCIDTGIFLCTPKIFSYIEEATEEGKTELAEGIAKAAKNKDAEIFDIAQIDGYVPSMRKEIRPFYIDIDSREDLAKAECLLIYNACKGRNDLLAMYVNKPIENFIVSRLVNTRITPNQITVLTNIIAYTATFLFLKGYLSLASFLTFIVSFLDGVDGKLSRVKLASTGIGYMEHASDFLFEHSWYIALAIYLSRSYGITPIILCSLIPLFDGFSHYCGQAFGKVIVNRPLADYGQIEQLFRKFDGRKNSYIVFILIGVLLKIPYVSLVAITVWSFTSAMFYCLRAVKHLRSVDQRSHVLTRKNR